MARQTAAEWARLVARWARSGQTVRDFAASAGVAPATLTWWRWRLKRDSRSATSTAPAARSTKKQARRADSVARPVELLPVTITTRAAPLEPGEAAIDIVLGDLVVRVRRGFDARTLGRVLDVLEGADEC